MTDLTPKFCPHCLADFESEGIEIKTSNPPKCGRCLLPLWWEDRRGGVGAGDRPWPVYTRLLVVEGQRSTALEGMRRVEGQRDAAMAIIARLRNLVKDFRQTSDELEDIVRDAWELP